MSKQNTVINYNESTVEDGGILYDMEDLCRLSSIYERLCTAEYLYENDDRINSMEFAYEVACDMNDYVDNMCEYERKNIIEYLDYIVQYHEEDCEEE